MRAPYCYTSDLILSAAALKNNNYEHNNHGEDNKLDYSRDGAKASTTTGAFSNRRLVVLL